MVGEKLRVEDYMSTPVVVVGPRDNLAHARRLMIRYRVGRLVVIRDHKPIGIITKADFAKLATSRFTKRGLDRINVEEIMTTDLITTKTSDTLLDACRILLEKNIGGLPVVDEDEKLVGILTKTDIVRAYAEHFKGKHIAREYMEVDVAVVNPTHSLTYVAELLDSTPSKRVLVVDRGKLVGIIAPSDIAFLEIIGVYDPRKKIIIRRFTELPKGRLGPLYTYTIPIAQDIMTPDPIVTGRDSDLADVASIMLRQGFSSVPVVRDEEILGVVVKHGILRAFISSY